MRGNEKEREKRREAMRSDWEKGSENVRGKGERQCLVGKVRGNEKGEGERQLEGRGRKAMRRERERGNEKGEGKRQ